jgi:ParB-like chromosome segregation protein Spo0J
MSPTQLEDAGVNPSRPWPADQVERWPIERLIPYAHSPRLHTEADRAKIAGSILTWGWTTPLLVDEEGRLIAGEARLGAALSSS